MLDENGSTEYHANMSEKPKPISEVLREALRGVSRYRVSKDLGIAEATLSRFCTGKGGLRLKAIDAVCAYLGLKLVADKRPARKKKTKGVK